MAENFAFENQMSNVHMQRVKKHFDGAGRGFEPPGHQKSDPPTNIGGYSDTNTTTTKATAPGYQLAQIEGNMTFGDDQDDPYRRPLLKPKNHENMQFDLAENYIEEDPIATRFSQAKAILSK